ncbi:hypothetical protein JJE73_05115 [Comamonas sp. JC664]|nr:hypothetical protein [Comamonas sp. JC664]
MELYLDAERPPDEPKRVQVVARDFYAPAPERELSRDEAPRVFQEAVQVLAGKPSKDEVQTAWLDISAACSAELTEACTYAQSQFQRPIRVSGEPPSLTSGAINARTSFLVVLRARLGTDGRIRRFTVIESGPYGITEAFIKTLGAHVYEPARLAGHPIEFSLKFNIRSYPQGHLLEEAELKWLRARVTQFPASEDAWLELARFLARHAPEDPQYEKALDSLNRLQALDGWSATELAWLRAQEGEYAEAEPLAKVGRRFAPENPYALETSARVAFHLGRCRDAIADQQQAVAKLPKAWPEEERVRFKQALDTYQRGCSSEAAPAAPLNG